MRTLFKSLLNPHDGSLHLPALLLVAAAVSLAISPGAYALGALAIAAALLAYDHHDQQDRKARDARLAALEAWRTELGDVSGKVDRMTKDLAQVKNRPSTR